MNLKLEAIIIPVADVDRAKKFYADTLGFRVDADLSRGGNSRIVQVTPPGSECSIQFGVGITPATPGTYQGTYLITTDIEATRADLVKRGVEVSEPYHFGPQGQTPGIDPQHTSYNSFLTFSDPDGNGWLIQEVKQRAPGR
ncbi:VOC family protein [Dictyobacter aurantiacus]|uniref:VOC domain-containing protein n=1 Tax=Dictyobacter aurantiacus TaxID=1936993 RepID=A0A401ZTJ4_9CHLR|nr:VOC family protein [Dictyobacter aurantiacus]GCE10094.1 hypothetical protein KDAU_74230 [Dictyobacter aurantiacus]